MRAGKQFRPFHCFKVRHYMRVKSHLKFNLAFDIRKWLVLEHVRVAVREAVNLNRSEDVFSGIKYYSGKRLRNLRFPSRFASRQ